LKSRNSAQHHNGCKMYNSDIHGCRKVRGEGMSFYVMMLRSDNAPYHRGDGEIGSWK
jgi:hypothetical protein